MKKVLKAYLSYWPIPIYYVLLVGLIWFTVANGSLQKYFYLLFIPPLLQPFGEWLIHKYILHIPLPEKPGWKKNFIKRIHHDHHIDPSVPELLFAPPFTVAISLLFGFFAASLLFYSFERGLVFFISILACYVYYEWVHLSHHLNHKPLTSRGRKMRKAHLWHHYKNENYWWGITSPIADKLLGTFPDPKSIPKSETVKFISGQFPEGEEY